MEEREGWEEPDGGEGGGAQGEAELQGSQEMKQRERERKKSGERGGCHVEVGVTYIFKVSELSKK